MFASVCVGFGGQPLGEDCPHFFSCFLLRADIAEIMPGHIQGRVAKHAAQFRLIDAIFKHNGGGRESYFMGRAVFDPKFLTVLF